VRNRGPISPDVLWGLRERGITLGPEVRFSQQLQEADLVRAARIIALDEAEHRRLLGHRFPQWVDRMEFWGVPDVPRFPVADALATMDAAVQTLIRSLSEPATLP
jgi:protein-tyrosine phosphatase